MRHVLFICTVFCWSLFGFAKSPLIAIVNAHIFTMGELGEIKTGTILFDEHKIHYVGGSKIDTHADIVIDAQGEIVTPGLIITDSTLGADEVGGEKATVNSQLTDPPFSAGIQMSDSVNPRSTLIPIARMTGTTSALLLPRLQRDSKMNTPISQVFSGQAALINLSGDFNSLVHPKVAMVLHAGEKGAANTGGSNATFMAMLRTQVREARSYLKNRDAYDRNQFRHLNLKTIDLEALAALLRGEMPLLVEVHRASEIRSMIAFAKKEKMRLIVSGGSEAWLVAEELAAAKIPVLLNSQSNLPVAFEALSSSIHNAVILQKAGVQVSIHGPEFSGGGKAVRLFAGICVGRGLPWMDALKTVTINPAKAFGVSRKIGSLEVGKQADLVLWQGDPLDTSGYAKRVFIKGKDMPMRSRQTELRDRYIAPDNGLPLQYR